MTYDLFRSTKAKLESTAVYVIILNEKHPKKK